MSYLTVVFPRSVSLFYFRKYDVPGPVLFSSLTVRVLLLPPGVTVTVFLTVEGVGGRE